MIYLRLVLRTIVSAFSLVLAVYCVSSWFIRDPFNKFMQVLSAIVDPVLDPIRWVLRLIPFIGNLPIDFSPIIAYFFVQFISTML